MREARGRGGGPPGPGLLQTGRVQSVCEMQHGWGAHPRALSLSNTALAAGKGMPFPIVKHTVLHPSSGDGKGPGMEPKALLCPFATLLSFLSGLQRGNPKI